MTLEVIFFVAGLLPWWGINLIRDKTQRYWAGYIYVCCVWLIYYGLVHRAPMGVVCNAIELIIAGIGLYRTSRWRHEEVMVAGRSTNYK